MWVFGDCGVDVGNIEAVSMAATTLWWLFREMKSCHVRDGHGLVAVFLNNEEWPWPPRPCVIE